jgi:hypothetical protein
MPRRAVLSVGSLAAVSISLIFISGLAWAGEGRLSGFAAAEVRIFPSAPANPDQDGSTFSPSIILQPEYRYESSSGADRLTIVPFLRYDVDDDNRTHVDLRELSWRRRQGDWDLLIGVSKVFWGVTESRHLVDIINQTDAVENTDEEDKLGQPMVQLSLDNGWGMFSAFVLPRFRTRTFPDRAGRLRGAIPVEVDDPVFESGAKKWHTDFAARWWRSMGGLDLGLAFFKGTSREPRLVPGMRNGRAVLIPFYDQIDQASLDAQYTVGSWLWKIEAVTRGGQGDRFQAVVGGFEYTFFGAAGTKGDLGALAEYLRDGRGDGAPATAADDDVFMALRFSFNDTQSTEILAGAMVDRDSRATSISVEAERRIGQSWKLELELRAVLNTKINEPVLGGIRDDDFLLVRLSRFF